MRYYATLRNLEYTISDDEVIRYKNKGFVITPIEPIEPIESKVETEVVVQKSKRGRKPKNKSI